MTQFKYPRLVDLTPNAGTDNQWIASSGTPLSCIDEGATYNDSDYIHTTNNGADRVEIFFETADAPGVDTGHIFRWRVSQADSNAGTVAPSTGGANPTYDVLIYRENIPRTLVATAVTGASLPSSGSFAEGSYTLTPAQASNLADSDYENGEISLNIIVYGTGGNPNNRRAGALSWAEFELPTFNSKPTIAPNTADATDFGTDTTPTLEFTGSDTQDDDLEYEINIATSSTYFNTMDSYAWTEQAVVYTFGGASVVDGRSQSFTGDGTKIEKVEWEIRKTGNITNGTVVAKIYAHSGTFGNSSNPTGTALATSDTIAITALQNSLTVREFIFPTPYQTVDGTYYCISVECTSTETTLNLEVGASDLTPTHAGAASYLEAGTWTSSPIRDLPFVVYSTSVTINKLSSVPDAGFLNTVTGGDTHPFNAGEKISYTVQAGDALTTGTYYWRARAIDPLGLNEWSAYTTTRSFDIDTAGGPEKRILLIT